METNSNPEKAIDAIVEPTALTIVQMALLEKIKSPLLRGKTDDLSEVIKSIWVTSVPVEEAVRNVGDADAKAFVWAKDFSGEDFRARAQKLIQGIVKFWEMIPSPDKDSKKKPDTTQTDGLQS